MVEVGGPVEAVLERGADMVQVGGGWRGGKELAFRRRRRMLYMVKGLDERYDTISIKKYGPGDGEIFRHRLPA